jgi:hypothetical protein
MAFPWTYAFAYNTGSTINNTEQLGNLAIATGLTLGGGVEWWNGPDFQLGYVIARPVPSKTQPTPIGGLSAYTGFIRSDALNDASYVTMANDFKNRFINLPATGTFDNASQVATQANEDGLWTSWTPPIDQIIYSGSNYNSLWTSGVTISVGLGVQIEYYEDLTAMGFAIIVGFGTGTATLVSTQMYDLTNVNEIIIFGEVLLNNCTILINNGDDEYEIGYSSGIGEQTITCNITGTYNGYYYIMIRGIVSGTNDSGEVLVSSVQINYNVNYTPYPFPLWANIETTDDPSPSWTYTWRQITNVDSQLSVTPFYNNTNILLWYATSVTEPDPNTSNSPFNNGLTSTDSGVGFSVAANYWVIFGATALESGSGVNLVELSNDTAGNSLGSFTVGWQAT